MYQKGVSRIFTAIIPYEGIDLNIIYWIDSENNNDLKVSIPHQEEEEIIVDRITYPFNGEIWTVPDLPEEEYNLALEILEGIKEQAYQGIA